MSARPKPLVLGIAGGTGSGKTTVARNIEAGLPAGSTVVLDHDSYYRDLSDMTIEERRLLNFDHPEALDNVLLAAHLDALKAGQTVEVPIYDFVHHTRKVETRRVEPRPIIIVEGILVFADAEIRKRIDVKIFVDTDADIRVFRRIRRDMEQRGRTFADIREQYYQSVRPMHLRFVEPSKRHADLIIPVGGSNHVALDWIIARLRALGT